MKEPVLKNEVNKEAFGRRLTQAMEERRDHLFPGGLRLPHGEHHQPLCQRQNGPEDSDAVSARGLSAGQSPVAYGV